MKLKDVMTEHAECIGPDDSIEAAAQKMKSRDVESLPVCEDERLVGIVTDRDIEIGEPAELDELETPRSRQSKTG
jgi:CBS domain-containing protein